MNTEIANLVVKAARNKFRFQSNKGALSFEQLWDAPLTSKTGFDLDSIAKAVYQDVKAGDEISFVTSTKKNTEASEKLELVKFVIQTKLLENRIREEERERATKKQKLLELLEKKKNEKLEVLTEEEILAQINSI